jgi:hypothetical protein
MAPSKKHLRTLAAKKRTELKKTTKTPKTVTINDVPRHLGHRKVDGIQTQSVYSWDPYGMAVPSDVHKE